jgi:hypothetical protein
MESIKKRSIKVSTNRCRHCGGFIIGTGLENQFCSPKCRKQADAAKKKENSPRNMALRYVKSYAYSDQQEGDDIRKEILQYFEQLKKPAPITTFKKLVNGFFYLNKLLQAIEQLYRHHQKARLRGTDLKRMATELSEIKTQLWNVGHEFRHYAHQMPVIMEFVNGKVSELQMLQKNSCKSHFPEDFKKNLIHFHSKISDVFIS